MSFSLLLERLLESLSSLDVTFAAVKGTVQRFLIRLEVQTT
jgi:hypothetical protein